MIENVHWSSCKVHVILGRFLMKLAYSLQTFEKSSNRNFYENLSSKIRVVPCGRTDMTKLIASSANLRRHLKRNYNDSYVYEYLVFMYTGDETSLMPYVSCVTRFYQTILCYHPNIAIIITLNITKIY
jgi:hypothetical protein